MELLFVKRKKKDDFGLKLFVSERKKIRDKTTWIQKVEGGLWKRHTEKEFCTWSGFSKKI